MHRHPLGGGIHGGERPDNFDLGGLAGRVEREDASLPLLQLAAQGRCDELPIWRDGSALLIVVRA